MINSIILAACIAMPLVACSDDDAVMEQKDWSTTTYFSSTDESSQATYYKPAVAMWATQCRSSTLWLAISRSCISRTSVLILLELTTLSGR